MAMTSSRSANGGRLPNGAADDEGSSNPFSETVENILLAAEDRKAARATSSDQFDASMATEAHANGENVDLQRAGDTGPLTAHEIEQLGLLCASVSTSESPALAHGSSRDEPRRQDAGFAAVDGDSLTDLVPMLEAHVRKAENVNMIREAHNMLKQQEEEGDGSVEQWLTESVPERMAIVRQGMEAASILLTIMTSPGVDRRVLSEDSIEACISIMRHHLMKNVIPAITNTGHRSSMGHEASSPSKSRPPPAKKLKKSTSHLVRHEQQAVRVMKKLYKPAIASIGILSVLMERIEMLVQVVQLDDRPLLTLCSGALSTFSMEPTSANSSTCHLLQVASMGLITAVFRNYPRHRAVIIEDIIPLMRKLPTSKRSLRTFPLRSSVDLSTQGSCPDTKKSPIRAPGQHCIQVISALIISLIQSCVVMPTLESCDEAGDNNGNDKKTAQPPTKLTSGLEPCQSVCDLFATKLLQQCSRKGEDGGASEFRPILANLVDDLLFLQLAPEYPAAEMLLLALCSVLSTDLVRASSAVGASKSKGPPVEATYLATALDTMGKICAAMARHLVVHREHPLTISRATDKNGDTSGAEADGKEVNGCFCGRSLLVKTFMIDCDRCHRFFHGSCVGIPRDSLPDEWVCDDCRLQLMVLEQTQSFAERARRKSKKLRKSGLHDGEQDGSESGIDETYIFRQLLLNYLSHLFQTTKALSLKSSREFHISKWVRELDNLRLSSDANAQSQLFDPEVLCDHFVAQWDAADASSLSEEAIASSSGTRCNSSTQSFPCLSEEGNTRLMLALLATKSDMAIAYPRMMRVMVSLMVSSFTSLRKLSVKAISQVVAADPKIMLQSAIRNAVSRRFLDESTSVREAAVALVGSYVLQTPALANAFHAPLLSRVSDPGVSVRKRTIRIFRDVLLSNPAYTGRAAACSALLKRAADPKEDDGVRDLIHSLFHELWLGSGDSSIPLTSGTAMPAENKTDYSVPLNHDSGVGAEHDTRVGVVTPTETPVAKSTEFQNASSRQTRSHIQLRCDMAAEQMVEVVRSTGSGEILAALMRELLSGFSDAEKDRKAAERRKRQEAAQRHCSYLVESLIEQLVTLDVSRSHSGENAGDKLVAIIRTIEVFAQASPDLVLPHLDPILPYLKADNNVLPTDETAIVRAACSIVAHLAPIMGKSEIRQLSEGSIGDDLLAITKSRRTGAIGSAVQALSFLSNRDLEVNSRLHKKVMSLASTFYKYAYKNKNLTCDVASASGHTRDHIHRALTVLGSLCRHLDADEGSDVHGELSEHVADIDPGTLSRSNISVACYGLFSKFLEKDDVETKCAALHAMSGIFASQPRVMLAVEQAGIIGQVMSPSAHPNLQLDALRCWRDILIAEEKRVETGAAKAKMDSREDVTISSRISGDQDEDSSLVGGVLTKHAPRLFQMTSSDNDRIRLAAVSLLGALLRQGLINPMETVPYLLALQGDVGFPEIRSSALKLLIREGEKRPAMLRQRVCAGVRQAYYFQRVVYPNDVRVTAVVKRKHGKEIEVESIFCSIFKECIRDSRKQKEALYKNLLGLFDGDENETSRKQMGANQYPYIQKLPLLSFAAQLLAHLPFNTASDPLFIIYHISCSAALHGEQLLDKLAKVLCSDELDEDNTEEDCLEIASKSKLPSQTKEASLLNASDFDLMSFTEMCAEGNSIVLLLRLKQFLCKVYSLSETRCLGYIPNGKESIIDKGICVPDKMPVFNASFQSCCKPSAKPAQHSTMSVDKDSLIRQYAEFRRIMRSIGSSDSIMDDGGVGSGKRARKRGKKRKASDLSDEDDSEYESS